MPAMFIEAKKVGYFAIITTIFAIFKTNETYTYNMNFTESISSLIMSIFFLNTPRVCLQYFLMSTAFNPKKGGLSELQIRVGGGGGAIWPPF